MSDEQAALVRRVAELAADADCAVASDIARDLATDAAGICVVTFGPEAAAWAKVRSFAAVVLAHDEAAARVGTLAHADHLIWVAPIGRDFDDALLEPFKSFFGEPRSLKVALVRADTEDEDARARRIWRSFAPNGPSNVEAARFSDYRIVPNASMGENIETTNAIETFLATSFKSDRASLAPALSAALDAIEFHLDAKGPSVAGANDQATLDLVNAAVRRLQRAADTAIDAFVLAAETELSSLGADAHAAINANAGAPLRASSQGSEFTAIAKSFDQAVHDALDALAEDLSRLNQPPSIEPDILRQRLRESVGTLSAWRKHTIAPELLNMVARLRPAATPAADKHVSYSVGGTVVGAGVGLMASTLFGSALLLTPVGGLIGAGVGYAAANANNAAQAPIPDPLAALQNSIAAARRDLARNAASEKAQTLARLQAAAGGAEASIRVTGIQVSSTTNTLRQRLDALRADLTTFATARN